MMIMIRKNEVTGMFEEFETYCPKCGAETEKPEDIDWFICWYCKHGFHTPALKKIDS